MRIGIMFVSVLFFLFGYAQGAEYLVRIAASESHSLQVIELVDDYALIVGDDEILRRFEESGTVYAILDQRPRDKFYLFVFPLEEDEDIIAQFGRVIDRYEECVLLATNTEQVPRLNELKVELKQLTLKPIVKRDPGYYDFSDFRVTRDTLIEEMLNNVDPENILNTVLTLQRMYTRHSMSDSNRIVAVNYIKDMLIAHGCDSVYRHSFSSLYGDNVVGLKLGEYYPTTQNYVLIGGHLDDVPSYGYAPGADDNASGVAAVLEAARVMRNYDFEHTIRFAAFNAEEQGLIGSNYLAGEASSENDTIIAALCYDMIGYVTAPLLDTMRLRYTTAVPGCSLFACEFYQSVADTYTQLKIRPVRYTGTSGSSDHASFWQYGYMSTGGIERVLCPGYHTVGDTIGPTGFNNLEFATEVIKTAIAVLATLAVPVDSGTAVSEAPTLESSPLFVVKPNPGSRFDIGFAIDSKSENIDLVVYDCMGRFVQRLASGRYYRGVYSCRWDGKSTDGSELTPGVYFLTLNREDRTERCKVILLD
ncbi:MAG: M20/M25/M40 family metallo-hydrolase [candidate division WOR-3 bacterium]|nr:MAG: M20/M25/M40 family metallo-hydrolase [candidate division WOR-3 bacterium]